MANPTKQYYYKSFILPPKLAFLIEKEAVDRGISESAVIRELLAKHYKIKIQKNDQETNASKAQ